MIIIKIIKLGKIINSMLFMILLFNQISLIIINLRIAMIIIYIELIIILKALQMEILIIILLMKKNIYLIKLTLVIVTGKIHQENQKQKLCQKKFFIKIKF